MLKEWHAFCRRKWDGTKGVFRNKMPIFAKIFAVMEFKAKDIAALLQGTEGTASWLSATFPR